MSATIGANNAYPPGEITYLGSEGELKLDAILTDVIAKGSLLWHDYNNPTAGLRGWKITGTAGAEHGQYAVCTLAKIAGVAKVTGVKDDSEVSVTAGGTLLPGCDLRPSATVAGAVDMYVAGTDDPKLKVGKFIRISKYANSGDGNHSVGQAAAADVIIMKLRD
jgi:hypothetical protein